MTPPKTAFVNNREYSAYLRACAHAGLLAHRAKAKRAAQDKLRLLDLNAYEKEEREKAGVEATLAHRDRVVAKGRAHPMTETDYAVWERIKNLGVTR